MDDEDIKEMELGLVDDNREVKQNDDLNSSLLDMEEEANEIGEGYKSEDEMEDFISGMDTHSLFSGETND